MRNFKKMDLQKLVRWMLPSKAGRPQILLRLAPGASCFLWLQVEGEDGAPRDPVTVTWLPYFKVPLTTGKEQPRSEYPLFNI